MTLDRTPKVWEVTLQKPDGSTMIEKVETYWSSTFEGVKDSVAHAARAAAWLRNKKKLQFQVVGEPKLVTS